MSGKDWIRLWERGYEGYVSRWERLRSDTYEMELGIDRQTKICVRNFIFFLQFWQVLVKLFRSPLHICMYLVYCYYCGVCVCLLYVTYAMSKANYLPKTSSEEMLYRISFSPAFCRCLLLYVNKQHWSVFFSSNIVLKSTWYFHKSNIGSCIFRAAVDGFLYLCSGRKVFEYIDLSNRHIHVCTILWIVKVSTYEHEKHFQYENVIHTKTGKRERGVMNHSKCGRFCSIQPLIHSFVLFRCVHFIFLFCSVAEI